MGLAGLANRDGPRLFIRGHFAFNGDADRFWLARLGEQYGMKYREVRLDEALDEEGVVVQDALGAGQAGARPFPFRCRTHGRGAGDGECRPVA